VEKFPNDDVIHVVFFDLGSEIDVDLDSTCGILFFDGVQERVEPFRRTKVTNDPCEINLD
jgi:hypothetical protein